MGKHVRHIISSLLDCSVIAKTFSSATISLCIHLLALRTTFLKAKIPANAGCTGWTLPFETIMDGSALREHVPTSQERDCREPKGSRNDNIKTPTRATVPP